MSLHSRMYQSLGGEEKAHYEARARAMREQRREEALEKVGAATREAAAFALLQKDSAVARPMSLRACRFDDRDTNAMALMWKTPEFTERVVVDLRKAAMTPPAAPTQEQQQRLLNKDFDQIADRETPSWTRDVCRARAHLVGAAFRFPSSPAHTAFLFLFAQQSPQVVSFLPLRKRDSALPPLGQLDRDTITQALLLICDEEYTFERGQYVLDSDIGEADARDIEIITDMHFATSGVVRSFSAWVPWVDFKDELALPKTKTRTTSSASTKEKTTVDPDNLLASHPWLLKYGVASGKERVKATSSASTRREETAPEPTELTDTQLEQVWQELEAKRRTQSLAAPRPPEHFNTTILGGAWTKKQKSVSYDVVKGYAMGKQVSQWCERYSLPQSASFYYSRYGNSLASGLALYWCQRLEYFFAIWESQPDEHYVFSESDLAGAPEAPAALVDTQDTPNPKVATARVMEVQRLVPGRPVLAASSSS